MLNVDTPVTPRLPPIVVIPDIATSALASISPLNVDTPLITNSLNVPSRGIVVIPVIFKFPACTL